MSWINVRILIPGLPPLDAAWPSVQPLPVEGTFIQVRGTTHDSGFKARKVISVIEQDKNGMWEFWLEVHA